MFLNWLHHFRRLTLDIPVSVVAEDSSTYERLLRIPGVTPMRVSADSPNEEGSDGHRYDSEGYKSMVSHRAGYILILMDLHKGSSILYTDVDTVWLRDPRPFIHPPGPLRDMWLAVDDVIEGKPYYCTGFMAIRPTGGAQRLLRSWNASLSLRRQLNQPIFNSLLSKSDNVSVAPLPTNRFPSGRDFFGIPLTGDYETQ